MICCGSYLGGGSVENRALLHRARQKSRRQVTLLSKYASRKRCQGCGRTNYFHRVHTKKCDFCPCYFSTHRKPWDQVRLDIIMSGQVWETRMHAELRSRCSSILPLTPVACLLWPSLRKA